MKIFLQKLHQSLNQRISKTILLLFLLFVLQYEEARSEFVQKTLSINESRHISIKDGKSKNIFLSRGQKRNPSKFFTNSNSYSLSQPLSSRETYSDLQKNYQLGLSFEKPKNKSSKYKLLRFKSNASLEKGTNNNVILIRNNLPLNSENIFSEKINDSDIFISKKHFTDAHYISDLIPNELLRFNKQNITESEILLIFEFMKSFSKNENYTDGELFSVIQYFDDLYQIAENIHSLIVSEHSFSHIVHNETLPNNSDSACDHTSSDVLEVINELKDTSICFVVESENECIRREEGYLVPKIGILCNSSVQIDSVQEMTNSTFKNWIVEIDIRNQKNLHILRYGDFLEFKNLTILSITNTTLKSIEENIFGDLLNLKILDLRNNLLRDLSWKIFLPHIHNREENSSLIFESDLSTLFSSRSLESYFILLSGNPLSKEDCGNEWALEHIDKILRETWTSEGAIESESENSLNNISDLETNLWDNKPFGRKERSTIIPIGLQKHPNFDCLTSRHVDEDRCYLCTPQLSIIRRTDDVLEIKCEVWGIPPPKLQWAVANGIVLKEKNVTAIEHVVSSVISVNTSLNHILSSTNSVTESFAICIANNERGNKFKSVCDLENLSLQELRPNDETSKVKIDVKISSSLFYLDPKMWEWGFSPCAKNVKIDSNLTFTISDGRTENIVVGFLHYTKVDSRGLKPGWYKLEVETPCGRVENVSLYYDGPPNWDHNKECPLKHDFQTLVVSIDTSVVEMSTTFKPEYLTTRPTEDYDENSPASITPSLQEKEQKSLSLLSAILIGIFSSLIIMVWVSAIIVMRHWKGNRIFFSQSSRNFESPFKIVFLGCLCRDKDGDSKKDPSGNFSRHEMLLLNLDRLVENPEYLSGSESEDLDNWNQPQVISVEKLQVLTELGEGAFGRVYLGLMEEADGKMTKVAVKTLKSLGPESQQDVKREVEMLSNLQHEKIIKFHGVCHDPESMFMVFEYMEHGDLNHFLKQHNEDCNGTPNDNVGPSEQPLTVMDCLQIALQIASGMTYLASQHYVHRDLATRNCLVSGNLTVKIGDFGMSRDVYTSDYYQIGGRALLPIRWMPPESILYRRFTIESDIWSFGVVLWEIFTGGKQPWYGYTNQEVITQITAGKELSCPDKCPPDMYILMTSCWHKQPHERMPMESLHRNIRSLTTLQPTFSGPI